MKSTIFLTVFLLLPLRYSQGQGRAASVVGLEMAIPTGDFGDYVGVGIGSTLHLDIDVEKNTNPRATFVCGYFLFTNKEEPTTKIKSSAQMYFVGGGVKYILKSGPYFAIDLAFHSFTVKQEIPASSYTIGEYTFTIPATSDKYIKYRFGFTPIIGYQIEVSRLQFDAGIKYTFASDFDNLRLCAGIKMNYPDASIEVSYW